MKVKNIIIIALLLTLNGGLAYTSHVVLARARQQKSVLHYTAPTLKITTPLPPTLGEPLKKTFSFTSHTKPSLTFEYPNDWDISESNDSIIQRRSLLN
jgi:hypothetical protein